MKILITPTECYTGPGAIVTIEGMPSVRMVVYPGEAVKAHKKDGLTSINKLAQTSESNAWYHSFRESHAIKESIQ